MKNMKKIMAISIVFLFSMLVFAQAGVAISSSSEYIKELEVLLAGGPPSKEGVTHDSLGRISKIKGAVVYIDKTHLTASPPYIYVGFDTNGDLKEDYRLKIHVSGPGDPFIKDCELSLLAAQRGQWLPIEVEFGYPRRFVKNWKFPSLTGLFSLWDLDADLLRELQFSGNCEIE